jgi:hypothetical protein
VRQNPSSAANRPDANVVPLNRRAANPNCAVGDAAPDGPDLDIKALHAHWLHGVFASIDLLDGMLAQLEVGHAALPVGPGVTALQSERSRLSCELFQLRMAAVRLSSKLAQLRQRSFPAPPGR